MNAVSYLIPKQVWSIHSCSKWSYQKHWHPTQHSVHMCSYLQDDVSNLDQRPQSYKWIVVVVSFIRLGRKKFIILSNNNKQRQSFPPSANVPLGASIKAYVQLSNTAYSNRPSTDLGTFIYWKWKNKKNACLIHNVYCMCV